MNRRHVLAAGGVLLAAGATTLLTRPGGDEALLEAARGAESEGESERDTESILPDTDHETPVHVIDAPEDGPTAMVFGGVHGDERNGIAIAHEIAEWEPDAGTLVVVPETDRVAVENGEREGREGDLNRHFPAGEEPSSELARGVWDAVERHDPDVVLDLHRSVGIRDVHHEYVGQAIFHSADAPGDEIASYLNDVGVPWYMPLHRFSHGETDVQNPLLFQKAARELEATSYLFETTDFLFDQETKNDTTRLATAKTLEHHGLLEEGEG